MKMNEVKFDKDGLVPMIVQDAESGAVLSLFYANADAIAKMDGTGYVWRYSRSQKRLMQKGEMSGNVQKVVSIFPDCDKDALLVRVLPQGPACHTGDYSCFGVQSDKMAVLRELVSVIKGRKLNPQKGSYTSGIIGSRAKIIEKLDEECAELIEAEAKKDIVWEAADLLYFMLVYLENRDIGLDEVLDELKRRRTAKKEIK